MHHNVCRQRFSIDRSGFISNPGSAHVLAVLVSVFGDVPKFWWICVADINVFRHSAFDPVYHET